MSPRLPFKQAYSMGYNMSVESRVDALFERERLARLATTISHLLTMPHPLHQILQQCADAIVHGLDVAFARIWLLDESGQTLILRASAGMYTNLEGRYSRVPVETSLKIGWVARDRTPRLTNHLQEEAWIREPDWAKREGFVAYAAYPLIAQDRVVGVMAMFSRHPLSEQTLDELAMISGGIAQCIVRSQAEEALRTSQERLRQFNAELERCVAQRTAQLEATNRELEAFCYTVSHDLRAPIRHISGFVGLLQHDTGSALSEKGRRYLDTIAQAGASMGRLVEDLLAFSRLGNVELNATVINVNALIQQAVQDLTWETASRTVTWLIPPLPDIVGDAAMFRQVWSNLISNALKYTRPRAAATIEIGAESRTPSEVMFYIRDNGVGFDMQYREKLFEVFQRLHGASEFEGTGVGLAIARRVIERHGGRIWAEGKINEGATFYFSLPQLRGGSVPTSTRR